MQISEKTEEMIARKYPGYVLIMNFDKEDLKFGMKIVIKDGINPRYSQKQKKYCGSVFTLKEDIWGTKAWWTVEENDSQWYFSSCDSEFYVIMQEKDWECLKFPPQKDPFNENMLYNIAVLRSV